MRPCGISNPTKTRIFCYANSVLQVIAAMPGLDGILRTIKNKSPAIELLEDFVKEVNSLSTKPVSHEKVRTLLQVAAHEILLEEKQIFGATAKMNLDVFDMTRQSGGSTISCLHPPRSIPI
jgi:hypothetical protein